MSDSFQGAGDIHSHGSHGSRGYSDHGPSQDTQPLTVTIEPSSKQQYSYQAKQYRLERAGYRLEKKAYRTAVWSLIILGLYAGLTLVVAITSIKSANAAKQATVIARDAYQTGQRAYIVHKEVTHTVNVVTNPSGKDTFVLEISAKWDNAGNTPAVEAISILAANEQEDEITEREFLGTEPEVLLREPVAAIGPKVPFCSRPARLPETFATDDPQTPRYVWGWVLYRDIFPATKVHVTEFCYRVTKIEKIDDINYAFDSTVCSRHNCIDEFCEDYGNIAALSPTK